MELLIVLLSALFTLLFTLALVPLNIRLSKRFKLVAEPDQRKIHKVVTPEGGGFSFGIPIIIVQMILGAFTYNSYGILLQGLAITGAVSLIFGALDDRFELKPMLKLLGYIVICLLIYLFGFRIPVLTNPFGEDFVLGWLAFPATIIWFLVVINAINLIDGVDGLASGITVIVSAVLLVVALKAGNMMAVTISAMLIAGNLAFLKFNFHPARIFMGDTGATFIGLNLAAISTTGNSQFKGITSMTLIIPLTVLAVPLLDVSLALLRRIRIGNVFTGDRAHIHHLMLGLGLSQKAISIIVYFVTMLFGMIAIGFSFSSKKVLFLVLLAVLALMVVIAYYLMRQEQKK